MIWQAEAAGATPSASLEAGRSFSDTSYPLRFLDYRYCCSTLPIFSPPGISLYTEWSGIRRTYRMVPGICRCPGSGHHLFRGSLRCLFRCSAGPASPGQRAGRVGGASSTDQGQGDFSLGAHPWGRATGPWQGFRTNVCA